MSTNTRQELRCTLQRWRSGEVVCSVVNYPLHRGFRWVGTTHHLLSVGSASWAICRIQTHLRNWLEELRKNNVLSIVVSQDMESFCLQEQSAVCYLGYSPLCLQKCTKSCLCGCMLVTELCWLHCWGWCFCIVFPFSSCAGSLLLLCSKSIFRQVPLRPFCRCRNQRGAALPMFALDWGFASQNRRYLLHLVSFSAAHNSISQIETAAKYVICAVQVES